jgi:adenylate kinase
LNENDCRNRGFVLDGFPRSYADCQYVFLKKRPPKDDEDEVEDDEEEEPEDGDEPSDPPKKSFKKNYIPDSDIYPKNVIVFKGSDHFLTQRVKEFPENKIEGTHYNLEDMKRRLAAYNKANLSENAEPSISHFFEQQKD